VSFACHIAPHPPGRDKYNPHPNILPEDTIEEVNNEINEIGSEYNYEGYTVTLSKKVMEIKHISDIIVDPNVLPPLNKKKVLAKIVKEKATKKKSDNCASPHAFSGVFLSAIALK